MNCSHFSHTHLKATHSYDLKINNNLHKKYACNKCHQMLTNLISIDTENGIRGDFANSNFYSNFKKIN